MSNLNPAEIENFAKDSAHWWDEEGPFKPLHKLNPVRIEFILEQIKGHFSDRHCEQSDAIQNRSKEPRIASSISSARNDVLKTLSIIDVGCGGGLVCEPLARLGAKVTGVDGDANATEVARKHAAGQGLEINYQCGVAEDIKIKFDVVLALEIIEHVPDPEAFVKTCFDLCTPDGIVIFSTLNRTAKSYALGIVAAEYILNWVPKGTHSWKKFLKPSELAGHVRSVGGEVRNISGLRYSPIKDEFSIDPRDVDVNYFLVAGKDTSAPRR